MPCRTLHRKANRTMCSKGPAPCQPCTSMPHTCLLQGKNSKEKACCQPPPPSADLHMQASRAGPESQQDALQASDSSRLRTWISLQTAMCTRQQAGGAAVGRSHLTGLHKHAACRAEHQAGQAAAPGPRMSLPAPCPGPVSQQQGVAARRVLVAGCTGACRTCTTLPVPAFDVQAHSQDVVLCRAGKRAGRLAAGAQPLARPARCPRALGLGRGRDD